MQEYIRQLRQNRCFKATELFNNGLVDAGVNVQELRKGFLQEIALLQNRTRGPLFELMAEVMIGKIFNISDFDRQAVFTVPQLGKRRFDLFSPSHGIAFEVKSGYVGLRSFTRKQIAKDKYLLTHDEQVKRIVWVCFRGATEPLVKALERGTSDAVIDYFDIGFGEMEPHAGKAQQVIRV